jgi:hypothetical protein
MSTTEIDTHTGDTPPSHDLQEQILSAVRKGHEVTLDAFRVAVDRVAPVTAKLPAVSVSLPDKLTIPEKLPYAGKLPFADRIPSRESVVANVRGLTGKLPSRESVVSDVREFAGQLLAEQRKFNGEFRKTAAGLRPAPADKPAESTGPAEFTGPADYSGPAEFTGPVE